MYDTDLLGAGMSAIRFSRATSRARLSFALHMVEALENDARIHETPAIVDCRAPSALAHAGDR